MKKFTVLAITLLLAVCFSTVAWAEPMKLGKEFMSTGEMWKEAAEQFEQVIRTEPANAEAQYLLGQCYMNLGRVEEAKKRFSSAKNLKSNYGPKAADIFEKAGWSEFNLWSAKSVDVQRNLNTAVDYDPARRSSIVNKLVANGQQLVSEGILAYAIKLSGDDPELKRRLADFWWEMATRETLEDRALHWRELAMGLWPEKYKEILVPWAEKNAKAYLEAAKAQARIPDKPGSKFHENMTNELKAKAILFYNAAGQNGQAIVEGALPDTVEYMPRKELYMFSLRAGEQVSHWIKVGSFGSGFFSEKACSYYIVFKDGYIAKKGETRSMGMAVDFKFVAITDCTQNAGGIGLQIE